METCEYCTSTFKTARSLRFHQRKAKYCLKLRGVKGEQHICSHCKKALSSKYGLECHMEICVSRRVNKSLGKYKTIVAEKNTLISEMKNTITDLQEQVASLQDKLASIAEKAATKPTTQINTRINKQVNQLLPLTQEHIQSQVPHLTIEHIKRGAQGYADFALEFAFKNRLTCTDFSRRRVKYKDEEGNVIDDPDMKKVSKQFFQAIHDHNTTLTNQYGQELYERLTDILQNAGDELTQEETDKLQLTQQRILQEISKVNTNRIDVTDIVKGKKSELLPEFVREICATSS